MGGCVSVSMACDLNQISRWLCYKGSYVYDLSRNIAYLEKALEMLKAKRDDMQRRVDREELTGRKRRLAQVQVWFTSVLTIETQVNYVLNTNKVELQKLCLCGFCSKDLRQSYRYGKRVIIMLKEVKILGLQGDFDVVAEIVPVGEPEELPIHPTIVGQETLLEKVWNHFMEDKVGIVGLYGMGGVGKTTLLMQINNKFTEIASRFDFVIWIVVSNGATVHKIQGDLAAKIGLGGIEWDAKNENQRTLDIHNVLKRQKFVLLLDDIWEKVNLKVVGIPNPSRENGCKVAFTTRSREVCGRMGVDDPIKVSFLPPKKAWELFQKKVGLNTLKSHPDIPELARKVSGKCRGLPLTLNVIGETMACKTTVQEWHHAIDVLTSSAIEFSGMENDVLHILKYSYDNLNGEQVKSCFLYYSLFPEDHLIDKERLIEYWIAEGFIDEKQGRDRATNQGYVIIGILIRACLLSEEVHFNFFLKMHDVVREMTMWILSDLGKHKDQYIVQAGVGICEVPKVKSWRIVKKMSLMYNEIGKIDESPECPELLTLLLKTNKLVNISGEFFRHMPKLLVLDLSENRALDELPEEISTLVSLRYLNLSYTNIEQLPHGLQALKMLTHLNLGYMSRLKILNGISNLSSLRTLLLRRSQVTLDMNLMKELELLEHLEFVSINTSSKLVKEQVLHDSRVAKCIRDINITELPEESMRILVLPAMDKLLSISIRNCGMSEIHIENTIWNRTLKSPCFSNVSSVSIVGCDGLKDLTWLLFAPNLTFVSLDSLNQLVSIISEEKAICEGESVILPFQKLEYLYLFSLPVLKSIYWSSLPFPCLRRILIRECPNLRKLPLDSQNVLKVEEFIIDNDKEWRERVEWEDEATRLRFLPCIRV